MKSAAKIFFLLAVVVFLNPAIVRAEWRKVKTNTLAWLHAVYFANPKTGWISGSNGTFLKTTDGGISWNRLGRFDGVMIRDVYFTDENHGFLLTEKDVYSRGNSLPSSILETTDGGETWERAKIENAGTEKLVRFFFSKNRNGYAVGEAGAIYELREGAKVWKKLSLPVRNLLLGGGFADLSKGIVVGGAGAALYTDDNGASWKPAIFTKKALAKLNAVFFASRNVGWIVGANGKIYSTNSGGRAWREQNSPTAQHLLDVAFVNTAEGWAVGEDGTVLHTTTAGNIWQNVPLATKHKLERIFYNGETAWIVGFGGTILVNKRDAGKNLQSE